MPEPDRVSERDPDDRSEPEDVLAKDLTQEAAEDEEDWEDVRVVETSVAMEPEEDEDEVAPREPEYPSLGGENYWTKVTNHPLLAAFEAGLALNRLRFHLLQTWIAPFSDDRARAQRAMNELGRLTRSLRTDFAARESIETRVHSEIEELLAFSAEEGFSENLLILQEELYDPDIPYFNSCLSADAAHDAARRDLLFAHLRGVIDAIDSLRNAILEGIDERSHVVLTLGEVVDSGARIKGISEYMIVGDGLLMTGRARPWRNYSMKTRKPGEIAAEVGWLDRVSQLLIELGLVEIDLPGDDPARQKMTTEQRVDDVEAIAEAIRAAICGPREAEDGDQEPVQTLSSPAEMADAKTEPGKPGYLGLILDEGFRTVRRQNREGILDLQSNNLSWGLLIRLMQSRGAYCSRQEIKVVWESHGNSEFPQDGTIDDAISRLR
jgi:hypothetical protein